MTSQLSKQFSVKLSAPGKVILFGEFSAVFNKPAVAATLGLRTKLHLLETKSMDIEINFISMGLSKKFPVRDIRDIIPNVSKDRPDADFQTLSSAVESLLNKVYGESNLSDAQMLSLMSFFYCYTRVCRPSRGFYIEVITELPIGSGVGSSASFSVVLSAALLAFEYYNRDKERLVQIVDSNNFQKGPIFDKYKSRISDVALSCEKIFHGNPSGVDHNTILEGAMVEFIKLDSGNKITTLNTPPIRILLVNTNVPRSTKKVLKAVKELKENHPKVIECVLQAMECIATDAIENLEGLKESGDNIKKLEKKICELITLNHGLLKLLGASHPSLEQIVSIAAKYKLHAKLTGGGGGGFGYIYIPSIFDPTSVASCDKELIEAGFKTYDVVLGGVGFTIDEVIY